MAFQNFDLVIFDCDGVLADSEVISAEILVHEMKRIGIEIHRDFVYANFVGKSFPTVQGIIKSFFKSDCQRILMIGIGHNCRSVFRKR